MTNKEKSPVDPFAFDASEVVGDDMNVLNYRIPEFIGILAVGVSTDD